MSEKNANRLNRVSAGRDAVGGDKYEENHYHQRKPTRLEVLFEKLNSEFENDEKFDNLIDDLNRYTIRRDVIGLEQKLINGNRYDLIEEDAEILKEDYYKKLTKSQLYHSAQKINAHLLAQVLELFRNKIKPLIRAKSDNITISNAISNEIIRPLINIIETDGSEDNVLNFSATDIEGMIYYLTGRCHIKWE